MNSSNDSHEVGKQEGNMSQRRRPSVKTDAGNRTRRSAQSDSYSQRGGYSNARAARSGSASDVDIAEVVRVGHDSASFEGAGQQIDEVYTVGRNSRKLREQAQVNAAADAYRVRKRYAAQGEATNQGGFVPAYAPASSQYSRSNSNYMARKKGLGKGAKIAIVLLCIVVVVGLGASVAWWLHKNSINEGLKGGKTEEELQAIDNVLTGVTEFDEPFVMLLLGSDARADDESMGARTDTNILVRVDTKTNTISMVSIPRDTMIQIPGAGTNKFNAAYFYGGVAGTIEAVKTLCNVSVDHYAEIDFAGLVGLIDLVGGVDVEVDELIDDPDAGDIVIPEGVQHLDGEAALVFSRSRAYVDGDYTRQRNQRKVIMALAYKLLETPAAELTGLIQSSTEFLSTDMTVDQIKDVANQIRHNNDYPVTIYSANIPSAPAMVGEVSYVIADTEGVREMMKAFSEGRDPNEAVTSSTIDTDIANAGGATGNQANTGVQTYDNQYYQPAQGYADTTYGGTGYTDNYGGTGYSDTTYTDPSYGTGYTDNTYTDNGYADTSGVDNGGGYAGGTDAGAGAANTGYLDANAGYGDTAGVVGGTGA